MGEAGELALVIEGEPGHVEDDNVCVAVEDMVCKFELAPGSLELVGTFRVSCCSRIWGSVVDGMSEYSLDVHACESVSLGTRNADSHEKNSQIPAAVWPSPVMWSP